MDHGREYRTLARQLTDPAKPAFGTNNLAYDDGKLNFALLWNYGRHFWVSDDFRKSLVASPASLQLHQYFADLQYKDRSAPSPDNPLPPGIGNAQGAVAMFRGWGNDIFSFVQTAEKEGRRMFAWKPMLVPKGPQDQKTFSHGHLWSVPRATRRPSTAWAVAEWAGGVEGWRVWNATRQAPLALRTRPCGRTTTTTSPPEQASMMIDFITRKLYAGDAFNFQYWPTYSDCLAVMTAAQVAMYRQNASVKTTLEKVPRGRWTRSSRSHRPERSGQAGGAARRAGAPVWRPSARAHSRGGSRRRGTGSAPRTDHRDPGASPHGVPEIPAHPGRRGRGPRAPPVPRRTQWA